jgi:hypothetical protein
MGNTGSPFNLDYPDPTDSPAGVASDALYYLASDMDYQTASFARDQERLRRRPAAKLAYESTVRYTINKTALSTVQFNTVALDTAKMTDLQRRPDRIYLPRFPRPALYFCGGYVVGMPVTLPSYPDIRLATNALWYQDITPNPDIEHSYDTRDMNLAKTDTYRAETFQVSTQVFAYQAVGGGFQDDIWIQLEINSGAEFTVWSAEMWAFWTTDFGDVPVS